MTPDASSRACRRRVRLLALLLSGFAAGARAGEVRWQPLAGHTTVGEAAAVARPIYNGQPTTDYREVVAVGVRNTDGSFGLCSGTLIAPRVVLTAGHCLSFGPRAAAIAIFPDGVTEVDHGVTGFAIHPEFNLAVAAVADVALLLLETPVAAVAPMPVATASPRRRAKGTIVGFGDDGPSGVGIKRAGTVRLRRCPRAIRRAGIFRGQLADSLCWKPKRRGQDTCSGDSGGPLIVNGTVAGVTSGGIGNCPGRLSWDTNVARFAAWIDDALAELPALAP